jgi:hypothetical protein
MGSTKVHLEAQNNLAELEGNRSESKLFGCFWTGEEAEPTMYIKFYILFL